MTGKIQSSKHVNLCNYAKHNCSAEINATAHGTERREEKTSLLFSSLLFSSLPRKNVAVRQVLPPPSHHFTNATYSSIIASPKVCERLDQPAHHHKHGLQ